MKTASNTAPNNSALFRTATTGDLAAVASSIMRICDEKTIESLYVTSCRPNEGKTTVAIRMAAAAATDIDLRVLLVDCNPSRPAIAHAFNLTEGPGFLDLLRGTVEPADTVQTTSIDRLHVVPFGPPSEGRLSIYSSENLRARLRELGDSIYGGYDLLLVDGASGSDRPDISVSTAAFDAVVLVLECEGTRWEVAQNYQARLTQASASLIGTVMNRRRYYIPKGLYA